MPTRRSNGKPPAAVALRQSAAPPQFQRQEERLPDGRSIVYYWFVKRSPDVPASGDV